MKKTILNSLTICTLFLATSLNAQVGVGVPAENIHPSAELEVKSSTKGFLPPRMTNAERNAIATPAAGLLIYQTDAVANNPAGLYFYDGTAWKNGIGAQGEVGPKGDKGDKGEQGAAGTMPSGTTLGEMKYWDGTKWASLVTNTNGQILTNCDGLPTWTTGGICPGKIASLNCDGVSVNGALNHGVAVSNFSFLYSYLGGNGGIHNGQVVISTGVTGLTATLQAGTFANGNGILTYTITGTPSTSGTASFALNIGGKTCTSTITVNSAPQYPTSGYGPNISDNDGNTYKTVYIGTQQWMAENLKTAKYSDGSEIPNVTDNTQWQNSISTGAWAYYENNESKYAKYGKLYNWYAVSPTTNGNKNVCPTGWHVPTDEEWTVLTEYLGGESVAGGKLKEVGTSSWISPNKDATNTSLFTGLPGGFRGHGGRFLDFGWSGYWWSYPQNETYIAWTRNLSAFDGIAESKYFTEYSRYYGLSIRCLRD